MKKHIDEFERKHGKITIEWFRKGVRVKLLRLSKSDSELIGICAWVNY
jgi:hypothetical protein